MVSDNDVLLVCYSNVAKIRKLKIFNINNYNNITINAENVERIHLHKDIFFAIQTKRAENPIENV